MDSYCVYKHTSPSGKVYIGITKRDVEKRWGHGKGYKASGHFYNAILKYGWDNINHEVLVSGLTKEQAEKEEKRLIALYDSTNPSHGYNMTFGGECGAKITDEVKLKISSRLSAYYSDPEAKQKAADRQRGKTHSEETKRKISESHKARITDDIRAKMSKARLGVSRPHKGHPCSEDTRKKISDAKKGVHYGGKGRKPRPVECLETGIVYESAVAASAKTGIGFSNIYRVCNGERGTAGGYKWRYADNYNCARESA